MPLIYVELTALLRSCLQSAPNMFFEGLFRLHPHERLCARMYQVVKGSAFRRSSCFSLVQACKHPHESVERNDRVAAAFWLGHKIERRRHDGLEVVNVLNCRLDFLLALLGETFASTELGLCRFQFALRCG